MKDKSKTKLKLIMGGKPSPEEAAKRYRKDYIELKKQFALDDSGFEVHDTKEIEARERTKKYIDDMFEDVDKPNKYEKMSKKLDDHAKSFDINAQQSYETPRQHQARLKRNAKFDATQERVKLRRLKKKTMSKKAGKKSSMRGSAYEKLRNVMPKSEFHDQGWKKSVIVQKKFPRDELLTDIDIKKSFSVNDALIDEIKGLNPSEAYQRGIKDAAGNAYDIEPIGKRVDGKVTRLTIPERNKMRAQAIKSAKKWGATSDVVEKLSPSVGKGFKRYSKLAKKIGGKLPIVAPLMIGAAGLMGGKEAAAAEGLESVLGPFSPEKIGTHPIEDPSSEYNQQIKRNKIMRGNFQ